MKIENPNISAVIITNDDLNVINAVNSIYESVKEIIIVNTVKSKKVNEALKDNDKVKMFYFKWCDHYSKARNFGLKKAKGDWILIIDSDEVLKEKICFVDDKYLAYMSKQYSHVHSSKEAKGFWTARLFQNNKGIFYKNRIHETIDHVLTPENTVNSDIEIIHNGYDITPEEMQKKLKRNYELMFKDKKNVIYNMHMGAYHFVKKEYETSLKFYEKAMKDRLNDSHLAVIQNNIHACQFMLGFKLDVLLTTLRRSLVFEPFQMYARINIIEHLLSVINDNKEIYSLTIKQELEKIESIWKQGLSNLLYNEIEMNEQWINEKYSLIENYKKAC